MEEKKVASIKLVSGEEIICTLLDINDDGPYTVVTIKDPARIENQDRRKKRSYSLTDWLIIHNHGMHDIEISKIITVNEIHSSEILHLYDNHFNYLKDQPTPPRPRASKKIGFLGNVTEYKEVLERIYRNIDPVDPVDPADKL